MRPAHRTRSPRPAAFPLLRRRLRAWFARHGRNYPWRQTHSWFHLLSAEMMLRRTRADQVQAVYLRFTERYRDPAAAAAAAPEELDEILRPLGLRWRQTQLRQTFAYLRDSFARRAPAIGDDLEAIPGVGAYCSAMLRSRLFGAREAAVDVNVARLMARLHGLPLHAESRRDRRVLELANQFVHTKDPFQLNLAMLDFCALVCRARRPLCQQCPLLDCCQTGIKAANR
ncbi:MAG: hypothetical protein K1X75_16240 [Leptospirales bacterium]|nr:hypothetical protein [Leptospirales bacterium]